MYSVYKIQNKITGQSYIGMSSDVERRFYQHTHGNTNPLLRKSIKEYGEDNFTFEIIKRLRKRERALLAENYYTIQFNSLRPNGFNFCLNGGKQCNMGWRDIVDLRQALRPKHKKIPILLSKIGICPVRFKNLLKRMENFTKDEVKSINKELGLKLKISRTKTLGTKFK